MEIEVGEFVRTKSGYIAKLIKYLENTETYMFDEYIQEIQNNRYTCISKNELKKEIVKHSKNLIELIEEGDYINGERVVEVIKGKEDESTYVLHVEALNTYKFVTKKEIKTILTHEQYKQNCYNMNNKNILIKRIEAAKTAKMAIAIALCMPGQKQPEIIINHYSSLDAKKEYYLKAYDDDLCLKANKEIRMLAIAITEADIFVDFQKQVQTLEF